VVTNPDLTEGLGELEIKPETLRYVMCATSDLLQDASFNVEQWVLTKVSDAFRRSISNAIMHGSGMPIGRDCPVKSNPAAACQCIVDQEHNDRTNNRNKHAVQVQPCNAFLTDETEQISADNRTHDSKHDVEPETLASAVDNLASDESCDKPKYDPAQDAHQCPSLCGRCPGYWWHPLVPGTLDIDQRLVLSAPRMS
jgi:hypothetical protein